MPVEWYDTFDKVKIKADIITHLSTDPSDTIEHCKEYSKQDAKRFYGYEIISFYEMHNNVACKLVFKGDREYFKPLT
jgi:hypothetical protein